MHFIVDRKPLFQEEDFVSHAGIPLKWKIECDAIMEEEWDCLALMIHEKSGGTCREAVGIPRGGVPLADAINKRFATGKDEDYIFVVDDVYTTGKSFLDFRKKHYPNTIQGMIKQWCVFSRKPTENGVQSLFTMN
tara:strand:+ start:334 stop:738 length:405 start_codon:yes stop_codon:yes gene_type:complete